MDADYIIVGAGVYGAAVAWHLAGHGARVCVVEQGDCASRASGGPGRRGVRANGRDLRELAFMPRACELWPHLHQHLGAEQFYDRCGHLLLAERTTDIPALKATGEMQMAAGTDTLFLSGDEVREREPQLCQSVVAALYCPKDGVADHSATTRAYVSAARARGVQFVTHTEVLGIVVENSRATGVRIVGGDYLSAGQGVLVLANSEVGRLVQPWAMLPVWNECLQVLVSAPLDQVPFSHLTGHWSRTVSLKTQGTDRVMISGGWKGHWDESTRQGVATEVSIKGNADEAIALFAPLADMEVALADANHLESMTPDRIPIIDTAADVDGLWFATGWCGHGWAIAPVVAEDLASWVVEGTQPESLKPFSARRFSQITGTACTPRTTCS